MKRFVSEALPPKRAKKKPALRPVGNYVVLLNTGVIYKSAQSRNRTDMVLLPRDFKSLASTSFAIWAHSSPICRSTSRHLGFAPWRSYELIG